MVRFSASAAMLAVAVTAVAYTRNRPDSFAAYPMNKPYGQSFAEGYSVLKHYGGNGPYSNRRSYGIGRDPPAGCAVDQVIMLKRHGERYPDPPTGEAFIRSLAKVYASRNVSSGNFKNDLEFLNRWAFFIPDLGDMALESFSGPYSGLLDAYLHGSDYRVRYGHLWNGNATVPIFSSGYERVIQTARKFGEGFLGWNYSTVAAVNIISESPSQGADSLTPTCFRENDTSVCDDLTNYQPEFDVAAQRLNSENGLKLDAADIYNLMQMAAFELNVRGSSPWVDVFGLDEWVSFGYTQDLSYYYCSGPGDINNKAVGAVYANASLTLLNEGPERVGSMFWNFCHDTNITPVLAALGVSSPAEDLPLSHIPFPNAYSSSDIVPMGGHFVIERLACNATQLSPADTYVRIVLNEAVVPFNACQEGPGFSCSLTNYTAMLQAILPDYISTCAVPPSYPHYLEFWWNWNATTALNHETRSYIPYEEGETLV